MDTIILVNILQGVYVLAQIYLLFMFALAILSILALFGIVNIFGENAFSRIYFVLRRVIDPAVSVIARFIPRLGQFDLPFLVFLILLWITSDLCQFYITKLKAGQFGF